MKAFLSLVIVLMMIGLPGIVWADGNELLSNCSAAERVADGEHVSDKIAYDATACMAYLSGVRDLNSLYRAAAIEDKTVLPDLVFCSPDDGVKTGQLARIVVKYLKGHPETLHRSEILLTMLALKDAFPCRR